MSSSSRARARGRPSRTLLGGGDLRPEAESVPAALDRTAVARATEGARVAFCQRSCSKGTGRRRDEEEGRGENGDERGQSNAFSRRHVREKKKQNTIAKSRVTTRRLFKQRRRERVIRASRATEASASQKRESTRETRACWEKTLRPRRDARLRGRNRAVTADARRASSSRDVPQQHGRVDSENLRFGEEGRE